MNSTSVIVWYKGKIGSIRFKPSLRLFFWSCWIWSDSGLSYHSLFQLLGWMGTGNSESQVTSMLQGGSSAGIDQNHSSNDITIVQVSLMISTHIFVAKLPNCQLHDSYTWSSNTATVPFPNRRISTLNPKIVNTEPSRSCMNMFNVILK